MRSELRAEVSVTTMGIFSVANGTYRRMKAPRSIRDRELGGRAVKLALSVVETGSVVMLWLLRLPMRLFDAVHFNVTIRDIETFCPVVKVI